MIEPQAPNWERAVLEKVALQAIREQRRARQWGILFKLLWLVFAFLILAAVLGWIGRPDKDSSGPGSGVGVPGAKHTAVVEVEGVIASEWGVSENNRKARYYRLTSAGRRQLEAESRAWASISEAIAKIMQPA